MAEGNVRDRAAQGNAALIDFITGNIDQGRWPAGSKLPTERDLEQQFGLSRNTLRKALKRLEAEGRITRQVGRGSFVMATATAEPLSGRIGGASPVEVMEVRLMVEPMAAELAATRATARDLAALEDCLWRADRAADVPAYELWDGRLHLGIVAAAKNSLLVELYAVVNEIRNQAEWGSLKARTATAERRALYQRQHRGIVGALKDRDGEQAKLRLRQHLLLVRANLLG